ncbi:MAG: glycosyltransferase family 39 protein [Candidatus Shapirobacteria bacterium]|nr:glycosyltransferase family 39 protein [Candidatus Shapirobacteria bacterium]
MKNKILFIIFLALSVIILFKESSSTIQYRSQCEDDQQFTILLQKNKFPQEQNYQRLLAKEKINLFFTAKYNNLGTIAIFFDNHQKINNDWVWFRIKEKGSNNWYYQNKYNTDQFNPDFWFTFGFPIINDSKNKEYEIEIESISGTPTDSISLHSKSKNFLAKYSFSKSYLKQNPTQILYLIKNKFKYYLSYVPKSDIRRIIINSIVPLLIFLFIEFKIFSSLKHFLKRFGKKSWLNNAINILYPIIIFSLTFIISGYFSTIGADSHHDGIMLKPALDVSQGQMLFKDTFTQYGALSTIIQSVAIKLFGEYLIVIRLTTAFFYALISVVLYFIWSKFLNKHLTFLSCLIWILLAPYYLMTFLPWSSVYALFFQCLAILFFQKYAQNNKTKNLIMVGVMSALTFWCKQNVGLYTIMGGLISLFIIKQIKKTKSKILIKNIILYTVGGIIISLPIFFWIIYNGAFSDWWKQSIEFSYKFISDRSSISFIEKMFTGSFSAISVWAITPIITFYTVIKEFYTTKKNLSLIILIIFGLFSWLQYYPVSCVRHTYWAISPLIGVLTYFFFKPKLNKNHSLKLKQIIGVLLIITYTLIVGPDINKRIQSGIELYQSNYIILNKPKVLKNIKLSNSEANYYSQTYENIEKYMEQNPNSNFINISPNALYLTFFKSKNFHPMYVNWEVSSIYPDLIQIRDNYVKENQPLIITMWDIPTGYCRLNNQDPEATTFLIAPCDKID